MIIPTCRVTVLEKSYEENDYGDSVDAYRAVKRGVRAHIYEKAPLDFDGTAGRDIGVRNYHALIPGNTPLEKGYRLRDESTDNIYLVDHVYDHRSFVGGAHKRAILRKVE